jgi:hypothetical protein
MGASLVEVQKENKRAKSTRVFVFDTASDVTDADNRIFQSHDAANIEVRIYLDREDPAFFFPPDVGADWTIIDRGDAVAVTRQMGEIYEAQWYFKDSGQAGRFRVFEERIRRGSITLQDWKARLTKMQNDL